MNVKNLSKPVFNDKEMYARFLKRASSRSNSKMFFFREMVFEGENTVVVGCMFIAEI